MANMELIETKTVTGSTVANIEFTSIPDTYTDLIVKFTCRTDHPNGVTNFEVSFNGVTSSLSGNRLIGAGGSGTSAEANGYGLSTGNNASSNVFTNAELFIPNYASAKYKTFTLDCAAENGSSTAYVVMAGGKWASTAAINAVKLTPNAGNGWLPGSTFSLYGVSKVTSSPKATGGIVSQDATYWYHTFPFSSTFTPTSALTNVDYLVIAGGGGGGRYYAGGGGAGGLRSTVDATGGGGALESKISLSSGTTYTITVGAGGAGGIDAGSGAQAGTNGVDSSIAGSGLTTITSTGGGGGGGAYGGSNNAGLTGGSGGGGNRDASTAGGSGTANQGYAGSSYTTGTGINGGGGGGGAGEAGNTDGNLQGGDGVAIPSIANATYTGVATYYAGGGSGGGEILEAGGLGGGGAGGKDSTAASSGLINTGGGGGGGSAAPSYLGGAGGSGLVVIRYAK